MRLSISLLLFFLGVFLVSCSSDNSVDENTPDENPINENPIDENPTETELYFPPINSDTWETSTIEDLGWNESAEQPLYDFLQEKRTKAFMILKNGKIVLEYYFSNSSQNSNHAWNSAGKTLTAFTVGIAQQEGFLSISDTSSDYLGEGWSSLTSTQEQNISVLHHLTMTTGLDYTVNDTFCTDPECLLYKNEPEAFWYYHNAPYTLLDGIITGAVGQDFEQYFAAKVRDRIGMQGTWIAVGYNNVYFSTARSMARFGLLSLNKGTWEDEIILSDTSYFEAMTRTSQDMNPSYGYLWWLNGKNSYRIPGSELRFNGNLIPNAPDDLIAGLGKNDQKLYVIPSQGLVIIRLGDDGGETLLGPSSFDNELWAKINDLITN